MLNRIPALCLILCLSQFGYAQNLLTLGEGGHPDDDVFHVNAQSGDNALRIETDATTRFRIFENGAVSIGADWTSPMAEGLYIKGNTGIGTIPSSSSSTMLKIDGNTALTRGDKQIFLSSVGVPLLANGAFAQFTNAADVSTVTIFSDVLAQGAGVILLENSNPQDPSEIRLDANFENSGNARIVTDEFEIRGGSDVTENFDIREDNTVSIAKGLLVSIDENSKGKLEITRKAHDSKLVGVVSGANGIKPGMIMGQDNTIADGDYPISLVGRAYVWADASYGKIKAGDLLTSSNTPGHAMKVKKYRKAKGSIIGKALTELDDGKGYVLVLINLQ